MSTSKLLVTPHTPDADGRVIHVTPESAGWTYVGFDVHDLTDGQRLAQDTGNQEVLVVVIAGKVAATAGEQDFGTIGARKTVFEAPPYSVYVPARSHFSLTAAGPAEIALCRAPGKGGLKPRLIRPEDVGQLTRGVTTNVRHVRNLLPETEEAESLLVVECLTPGGHWSSYPPHKHDTDNLPHESFLEETYYHRLEPSQGYGMQRVYTEDRSLDETMTVHDRDVTLVPKGYHPVASPHGFTLYYLNVMAGPKRTWKFHNEKSHEFLVVR